MTLELLNPETESLPPALSHGYEPAPATPDMPSTASEDLQIEAMGQEVLSAMQSIRDMMEDRAQGLERMQADLDNRQSRLGEEEAALARQREELARLAAERQRSIELESAQLAARESELSQRASAMEQARQRQEADEERARAMLAEAESHQSRNARRADVIAQAEAELKRLRDQLVQHCERLSAQRGQLTPAAT